MMYFIIWIVLSFVAGSLGSGRKIGFFGALMCSLILSPLVGFIVVGLSERISPVAKHTKLAQEEFAMGNNVQAAYHFNEAIANSPNPSADLLFNTACTYARMSQGPEAFKFLEKAIGAGLNIEKLKDSQSFIPYKESPEYNAFVNKSSEVPIYDRPVTSVADELLKLKSLVNEGVLTAGEFEIQKKKLLQ